MKTPSVSQRMKLVAAITVSALSLVACSKDSAAPPAPSASSTAASTPSTPASAALPKPAASAPAAAMVEIDLSSADPAWKGWVAQGPAGAKVLADGVHGARIAANGMDAFDVAFGQGKPLYKDIKSGLEAAKKSGNVKITITTDSADKLEWTVEAGSSKAYNFVWAIKASGKDMTCQTNSGMGVSSDAMLATLKTACGTLQKK
jgi:hypothetical protein